MKLCKSIKVTANGKTITIPAGTVLQFAGESFTEYQGMRITKNCIPVAAIEHVSQKRDNAGQKLCKAIRLGSNVIPAGTVLHFSAEGMASYKGQQISIYQIPSAAFENYDKLVKGAQAAIESKQEATLKMSACVEGTIIPAGTKLVFSAEGLADYNGKQISIYGIPSAAFESDDIHNLVNDNKQYKEFDAIEPGDQGYDQQGNPVRFLGKATGAKGYDALVNQFGNTSTTTFEELTNGMDQEEIDTAKFVAYSNNEGSVMVGLYGPDYVAATEAEEGKIADFVDVKSGDACVCPMGTKCTIVSTGKGTAWVKSMADALGIENPETAIKERLKLDEDDKSLEERNFALIVGDDNKKFIDVYGADGIKVFVEEAE